jgi:hypothetical protein
VEGIVPENDDAQTLATALARLEGFEPIHPALQVTHEGVRTTLRFERLGGPLGRDGR